VSLPDYLSYDTLKEALKELRVPLVDLILRQDLSFSEE